MSNFTKLMQQSAAGAAGGAGGLNVEQVFSTYLYDGNSSTQTITNGIDLAGEGGLVWIKARNYGFYSNVLFDTSRGAGLALTSDNPQAQFSYPSSLTSFNSNGFYLSSATAVNDSSYNFASWTFRKAPKFFDVVTYTGNGVGGREIAHNLGATPAFIIVKITSSSGNWRCFHTSLGATKYIDLNLTNAAATSSAIWNDTAPTSTHFTVGTSSNVNASGQTYVAYLFAHNDGDGDFGDGTQDIIKCGSYTGTATIGSPTINLGFEPQFVLVKRTDSTGNWIIQDNMRSVNTTSTDMLFPNLSNAATTGAYATIVPTATGFYIGDNGTNYNASGANYIYIAIRRGPMAVPESATDVFAIDTLGGTSPNPPGWNAGFPVDFSIRGNTASFAGVAETRLLGTKYLNTNGSNAENTSSTTTWDYMDGFFNSTSVSSNYYSWMWRRAPSFFDVVAYTGNGVIGREVPHNLGVTPELMIQKFRGPSSLGSSASWITYCAYTNTTRAQLLLNLPNAEGSDNVYNWNNTSPTSTHFTVHGGGLQSNYTNGLYITYLFASLDGISKVGSYTGNGSTQTINCGFSSGARFILIKRTDSTGDWYVWDAERGIVSANDPHLSLNTTAAEVTTDDSVDPVSSGFAVNQVAATNINVSSASYIYYAVA